MDLTAIVDRVIQKFPESVLGVSTFREETTLEIRSQDLLPMCRFLREDPEMAFDFLVDLCGVDNLPREPRFQVVYHLCSTKTRLRLRLKTSLPGENPKIASVFPIWKAADWLEREAFDMYGITFPGHPDLRRILLTPDWHGYPLRKDYPLRG